MILCCGESLIDMIPANDGKAFSPHVGGSVFNTAVGIGRQSVDVALLSGVSTDLFGCQLEEALVRSNVETGYLLRSGRPTTLAFISLVEGKATFTFYDENTAGRLLSDDNMPALLSDKVHTLFFGGISLAVEPCADAYVALLKRNGRNRMVMADPNIRPSFIPDASRYRERMRELFSYCDIVKISDDDLDWLDPSDRERGQKVLDITTQGVSILCLTLGAGGVEVYDSAGRIFFTPAPEVQVVDTVGAGDAFNAGMLVSLERLEATSKEGLNSLSGKQLEEAVIFATAFASETVTRAGSDPPWKFKG